MQQSSSSKPLVVQLLKGFPIFYGTRMFITVVARTSHWSLSWARLIQSTQSHPTSPRSILILSSHLRLGLPTGFSPSGFPTKSCTHSPYYEASSCVVFSIRLLLRHSWVNEAIRILAAESNQWPCPENTEINLWFPWKSANSLASWETMDFSKNSMNQRIIIIAWAVLSLYFTTITPFIANFTFIFWQPSLTL
jgi:hypothetical protein